MPLQNIGDHDFPVCFTLFCELSCILVKHRGVVSCYLLHRLEFSFPITNQGLKVQSILPQAGRRKDEFPKNICMNVNITDQQEFEFVLLVPLSMAISIKHP